MLPLPIDRFLPDLVAQLRASSSLVLVAEPGAGKTTRVPPAILAAGLLSPDHPDLIILQPRRVAARASALRIAQEQHWTLGREVGYHVRFDKCLTNSTRLRVLTEGILTRQLLSDPYLETVGCVILDEFHERSLHCDLALAMLREVQQTVRPDLKLLVMSATLDPEPIGSFLDHAPIMQVPGRTFPIDITYDDNPLMQNAREAPIWHRAAQAVLRELARETPAGETGDILVFLPGVEEIRRTQHRLEESLSTQSSALSTSVIPLHGTLPAEDQLRALDPAPPNTRKIILATNIAETSLTIPRVTLVIDSGLARIAGYDPRRGLDRLELARISRASADQRAGRAGRTAPGRCLRLWTTRQHRALKPFETPEIRRVDLASTVLTLAAWSSPNSNPRTFPWFEPPPESALTSAQSLLIMLGALTPTPPSPGIAIPGLTPPNSTEPRVSLTPLGQSLLRLPIHPRLARLLLAAADRGLARDGATLAALLSEKDFAPPTSRRPTVGPSDILEKIQLLDDLERSRFAQHFRDQGYDLHAARHLIRTRTQLLQLANSLPKTAPSPAPAPTAAQLPITNYQLQSPSALLQLILYAYPDRVVKRRENNPALGVMIGNFGVRLSPNSVVQLAPFYLALDARNDPRSTSQEALVQTASAIEESWLEDLFPYEIRRQHTVEWDESAQRVFPLERIYYRDLVLRESRHSALDPTQAAAALAAALRPRAAEIFQAHPAAAQWLARLELLRQALPERPWPTLSPDDLADLLATLAPGKKSLEEITRADLADVLHATLPHPLNRLFDDLAPETYTVPTGNKIKIQYAPNQPPMLAVRLQELFGLPDTPRIAAGRIPLLLHLLAPNYRPVQITSDLKSFWANAYFQVRKDLKARYPKHSWPENPLTAPPQAKGRGRSSGR